MKKFTLSVSEPCHENWGAMTPEEKGRFCNSCRKTVVDFSSMSDRQIAEFFKKPPVSVCGRFYDDQLNREIVVPKKKIPWVKYFFQFTWPAFVLFLKSCGQRGDVMGDVSLSSLKEDKQKTQATCEPQMTMGIVLPEITPVTDDTIKVQQDTNIIRATTVGITAIAPVPDTTEDVIVADEPIPVEENDATTVANRNTDTLKVISCTSQERNVLMGKIALTRCDIKRPEEKQLPMQQENIPETKQLDWRIHPNPVTSGQKLTVLPNQKVNGVCYILSVSGQVMHTERINLDEEQPLSIIIGTWPAGTYFILLMDEAKGKSYTEKFVVQ